MHKRITFIVEMTGDQEMSLDAVNRFARNTPVSIHGAGKAGSYGIEKVGSFVTDNSDFDPYFMVANVAVTVDQSNEYWALTDKATKEDVIKALQVALAEQIAPRTEEQKYEALIWSPAMVNALLSKAKEVGL